MLVLPGSAQATFGQVTPVNSFRRAEIGIHHRIAGPLRQRYGVARG
jgi:hypothetical protein